MKQILRTFLLAFIFSALSVGTTFAKKTDKGANESSEMYEALLQYKHNYIAKQLELSREQQNKFFPLYDDMADEIKNVNDDTRELTQRIVKSQESDLKDIDYQTATNAIIDKGEKIAAIEKKYYAKFQEILKPKQLFKLKLCEQEINKKIIEHIKNIKKKRKS